MAMPTVIPELIQHPQNK